MATGRPRSEAEEVARLTERFDALVDSLGPYRPGKRIPRRDVVEPTMKEDLRNLVGNVANVVDMTAGDSLVVAVPLIEAIDRQRSFHAGLEHVATLAYKDGSLRTLAGHQFSPNDFADLCWTIAYLMRRRLVYS